MVWREGSITAAMNRENAATITSTGSIASWPNPTGILGARKPQVALDHPPRGCSRRSTGSAGRYSGRIARTRSRNQEIDPVQPTRSAITVAGICGYADNNARIRGSTRRSPRHRSARTSADHRWPPRPPRCHARSELPCDGPLRQSLAAVKMPDQRPVFQGDHPSNLIGWPTFQPSQLAGFSTVVNKRHRAPDDPAPQIERFPRSPRAEFNLNIKLENIRGSSFDGCKVVRRALETSGAPRSPLCGRPRSGRSRICRRGNIDYRSKGR